MPLGEHEMVAFNLLNKSRPIKDMGVVALTTNECCSFISSRSTCNGLDKNSVCGTPLIPTDWTDSLLKGHFKSFCLRQEIVAPVSTKNGILFPDICKLNCGISDGLLEI